MPTTATRFSVAPRVSAVASRTLLPRFPSRRSIVRTLGVLLACGMVAATGTGCEQSRDFAAWVFGAPTSAEIAQTDRQIAQAQADRDAAQADADAAEQRRLAAEQAVAEAQRVRSEALRRIAALAEQAASAETEIERRSLRDAMSTAEAQVLTVDALLGQAQDQAEIAASDAELVAQSIASIDRRLAELASLRDEHEARSASATGNASTAVETTASVASAVFPQAAPAIAGIAGLAGAGIARLLAGRTIRTERKRAGDAIALIQNTERHGLVRDDGAAKPAKAAARAAMTDDQAKLLDDVTKHIRKVRPEDRLPGTV